MKKGKIWNHSFMNFQPYTFFSLTQTGVTVPLRVGERAARRDVEEGKSRLDLLCFAEVGTLLSKNNFCRFGLLKGSK
jgi:hypothetical protein